MMMPVVKIDHTDCWGCKACEVACKQEHNMPEGVKLIQVIEEQPRMIDDRLNFSFRHRRCMHCEQPRCQAACPEQAISKDGQTGIVLIDNKICNGCGAIPIAQAGISGGKQQECAEKRVAACMQSCPYDAISFDRTEGKARKCDMCHFRVINGLIPACADNVCLAHCIYFGDRKEINRVIKEKEWLNYRKEGKLSEMVIRLK
ncbi:MAG: 4Fe-4S dicluster domain-containing protein [Bacillota bacterium]